MNWLDRRRPEAPRDLRERIGRAVAASTPRPEATPSGAPEGTAEAHAEALRHAGASRLEAAVARPGRVRDSAFELLVADALITYACEAALEAEYPDEVLRRLVEVGRTR